MSQKEAALFAQGILGHVDKLLMSPISSIEIAPIHCPRTSSRGRRSEPGWMRSRGRRLGGRAARYTRRVPLSTCFLTRTSCWLSYGSFSPRSRIRPPVTGVPALRRRTTTISPAPPRSQRFMQSMISRSRWPRGSTANGGAAFDAIDDGILALPAEEGIVLLWFGFDS